MKSFLKVLTTVALAVSSTVALRDGVSLGKPCGGPHGDLKTDVGHAKPAQKVISIMVRAAKRVDAVRFEVKLPDGPLTEFYHGGTGGDEILLKLGEGEFVNKVEYHTGKKDGRTRVFYIKLSTNKGNYIEGGSQTDNQYIDIAPAGYQLGGLQSFSKTELDMASALWTSVLPIPPLPKSP